MDAPAADRDAAAYGIGLSLASAAFYALHTLRLSEFGDVDPTAQARALSPPPSPSLPPGTAPPSPSLQAACIS